MQDGIYFDMSAAQYFEEPRLSSTELRQILKSPVEYWCESRNNPLRVEKDSPAMKTGRLFHNLILGTRDFKIMPPEIEELTAPKRKIWEACQAVDIVKSDEVLKARGVIDYLKEDLSQIFKAGYPEVTIFWHLDGVAMKSRIDYLTTARIIDLKTYSSRPDNLDMFIAQYFFKYKVYDQLMIYNRAVEYALAEGLPVFGTDEQKKFVNNVDIQMSLVVFVSQNLPRLRVKAYTEQLCPDLFRIGRAEIEKALRIYKDYCDSNGLNQIWLEPLNLDNLTFTDGDFPQIFNQLLECRE